MVEGLEGDWPASAGAADMVDDGRVAEGCGDALDAAEDGAFGAPNGIQVPIVLQLVRPTANAALQTRRWAKKKLRCGFMGGPSHGCDPLQRPR
ncbi:hypothetical protein D3C71_1120180 [compost metagenome]